MTPQEQKELLELAAYAIGYKIGCRGCGTWGCVGECEWNPLIDKADAFDLMVKLHLSVDYGLFDGEIRACAGTLLATLAEEPVGANPEAATMLAITRAAAAIGKQMKEQMK